MTKLIWQIIGSEGSSTCKSRLHLVTSLTLPQLTLFALPHVKVTSWQFTLPWESVPPKWQRIPLTRQPSKASFLRSVNLCSDSWPALKRHCHMRHMTTCARFPCFRVYRACPYGVRKHELVSRFQHRTLWTILNRFNVLTHPGSATKLVINSVFPIYTNYIESISIWLK